MILDIQGSHKNLTSEFKEISRINVCFQCLNATIFDQIYQLVKEPPLNYWWGGGGEEGGDCSLYLNKLFVSLPISELYFFQPRSQAKYLFH